MTRRRIVGVTVAALVAQLVLYVAPAAGMLYVYTEATEHPIIRCEGHCP